MADFTSALCARPLDTIELAKESARKNLARRLVSQFGLGDRVANAIARMVVDPTAVRNQLDYPMLKRFPGGVAKFIVADVFSPALCASPINPRETECRTFPIGAEAGEKPAPPFAAKPDPSGQPVLCLTAESRKHVELTLQRSADFLKHTSGNLKDSIEMDGVLEPVTVFMAEINHRDREPSLVVPIPVDGSTRITFCHELTGFDPVEVVYRWPAASQREWRGKLSQILAVQEKPTGTVTDEQRAAHRALTLQARILVGVDTWRDSEPVTVVTAMRAIVGGIHVGHPAEWPIGSELDEIAEAVLDQLVDDKKLTNKEREYAAGLIDPDHLESKGFQKHQDTRAAVIAKTIFDPRNKMAISAGYRGVVVNRKRLGKDDKPWIAAELIMRSFRTKLKPTDLSAVRSALQRTINLSEWKDSAWSITDRSPDQLLNAALKEVRSKKETPGPAQLELGMLATYWLVCKRAIRRDTSSSFDQRSGGTILRAMLESEHGLHVLRHAIVEGRLDSDVHHPIAAVDGNGKTIEKEGGGEIEISDRWLRETFPESNGQKAVSPNGAAPQQTPQALLELHFRSVVRKGNEISDLVDQMSTIKDSGVFLAKTKGLPSVTAKDLSAKLQTAANRLSLWADIYDENASPDSEEPDQVDLLDEDKEGQS